MTRTLDEKEKDIVRRINMFVMGYIHTNLKQELTEDMKPEFVWDVCVGRIVKDLTAIELGIWELPTLEQYDNSVEENK